MESIVKMIEALKTAKWWLVLALMVAGSVYLFREPLSEGISNALNPTPNMEIQITHNAVIDRALEDFRITMGADRAFITKFHNGITDYDGKHMNRMSRRYEALAYGITPMAGDFQNKEVTLYTTSLTNIIAEEFRYGDLADVKDVRAKIMLEKFGVHATAVMAYYRDGKLIALVGVEYVGRPINPQVVLDNLGMEEWDSDIIWEFYKKKGNEVGDLL